MLRLAGKKDFEEYRFDQSVSEGDLLVDFFID